MGKRRRLVTYIRVVFAERHTLTNSPIFYVICYILNSGGFATSYFKTIGNGVPEPRCPQVSNRNPTLLTCFQEMRKRLEDHHVGCVEVLPKRTADDAQADDVVSPDTPNVLQTMMQLDQAKSHAKTSNKVALESEKEKDTPEKSVEQLKVCSRVRGRGHGSKSCGANLVVQGCTRTKRTFWTEDQFVVTASSGIRDHEGWLPRL